MNPVAQGARGGGGPPLDPITAWCVEAASDARRGGERGRAFVIGVSGPQGGGKSTLARRLVDELRARGLRAVTVSIEDFYLTHAEQRALAAAHPGDRCLEHRGYPGTHDVSLGERVLEALVRQREGTIVVPVYDKSAHGGRGDRASEDRFVRVDAPLDVVILEGWMLGFRRAENADCPVPLRAANEALPTYERWARFFDAFVHLVAKEVSQIAEFRVDAERARRAAGEPALSDEDARDYIERFLPAYEVYVPPLVASPPAAKWLRATIGRHREILGIETSA
ncbi:MAG: hypothetical protein U0414_20135 [Polyangiaceae bacterium]